jgi:hypothetical protein
MCQPADGVRRYSRAVAFGAADSNQLPKNLTMNKILAVLVASMFAAGVYAADAPAPAASAAKVEKKAEAKPAEAKAAAPAASTAKK